MKSKRRHSPFAAVVFDSILAGVDRGSDIRERINAGKFFKMSGPGFYHRMAKLEDDGVVVGFWVEERLPGLKEYSCGGTMRQRFYKLPEVNDETQ